MEHQERQAEHPERVLGAQLARLGVDVEALGETPDGGGGELGRLGVDVGQVVTRLVKLAAAVQHQALPILAARPGLRQQRGGETGLRQREADADVAPPLVPVGGVDADVDGLAGVGARAYPAADRHRFFGSGVAAGDGVDPAAHPVLRLPLAHRHAGLTERPGQQRPVQQVTGTDPQPPLRHDVEGEPRGVLVELPDQRVGAGRVEGRPGQFVQRGDDADVRHVGCVGTAELLGQGTDVVGADVPGLAGQRHHERDVLGLDPLGEQAHLRVAEQQGRRHPVADHGRRGGHRARRQAGPSQAGQAQPDRGPGDRSEQHLLGPQPERPGGRTRRRGHRDRTRPGQPVRRPAERCRQRAAREDAGPQGGNLARALPGPGHRLRRAQPGRARQRADGRRRPAPVRRQGRPAQRADQAGPPDLLGPARLGPIRLGPILSHTRNLSEQARFAAG